MLLEAEKENVCINKIVGQKNQEIEAEGDVIVNDIKPDVLSIISVSGIPSIYKKEIMDGRIRIDGSINTYIIYLADDEVSRTRSLNTVIDLHGIIEVNGCTSNMTSVDKITIKSIEAKVINSRKINVKAILEIETKIFSNETIEVISNINNIEDIQTLCNNKNVNSLIGTGSNRIYAKDTINIDSQDELAEIMKADIKIINKDIKISYNKVLVKADAKVTLIYLTENNEIKNATAEIPIMGFVDINNVGDDSICDVEYNIKNLIIKPNNSDNHSVYIEAEIEIICSAYETKDINMIEDLYSVSEDIKFNQKKITTMSNKKCLKETLNIKQQISAPEINKIYDADVNVNILNTNLRSGKIIYEGESKIKFIYEGINGIDIKEIQIPFNFEISDDSINENTIINTGVDLKSEKYDINNGNINVELELEFSIKTAGTENLNLISEISTEKNKQNNIYSMVIYFVKAGDTLWKIAKKFKSKVDDIAKINGIEDKNKIYTGQQLYIPKFVKNSVKV